MTYISKAELEIMDYLWSIAPEGDYFTNIIHKFKRERSKQTINTYLARLIEKGYVYTEGVQGSKLYYAKVSKEEYAWMLLEELYGGDDKKKIMTKLKSGLI